MVENVDQVPILVRREIEAAIVGPLVQAMAAAGARDLVFGTLGQLIDRLAFESGQAAAARVGGRSLAHFAKVMAAFGVGGAYDLELLELSDRAYRFNITRCAYAQMYERLGLKDLGATLSCRRDYKLIEGFNPDLKLIRQGTILEGCAHCDFLIMPK